jgi:hypothetical protein
MVLRAQPPAAGQGQGAAAKTVPPANPIKDQNDPRVKASIQRGIAYYRANIDRPENLEVGVAAAVLQALAKSNLAFPGLVPPDDRLFQALLQKVRAHCVGGTFTSSRGNFQGPDLYEAGLVIMGLAAADASAQTLENGPYIQAVVNHILASQKPNGSWGYNGNQGDTGDNSMTQYCVLGLWEATASAGVQVDLSVFDRAAQWLTSTQHASGGFEYHPSEGGEGPKLTMTAAGIGSVAICRDQLPGGKRKATRIGGVLRPVDEVQRSSYKPVVSTEAMRNSIEKGLAWMNAQFIIQNPDWRLYYLYAIERMATLCQEEMAGDGRTIRNIDWYSASAQWIISIQLADGQFAPGSGGVPGEVETAYAILFLLRSTAVSKKIHERRLGRGTLVSGRTLPQNLAELEQVGNQIKAKAIRGKAGDLLSIIETGNADVVEGAAEGILKQLYTKEWKAMGNKGDALKKTFDKGVQTKNSAVIKASMKALAATGDYRVVPFLIEGLYYSDDSEVQMSARDSLCLISRKFDGFGQTDFTSKEEWEAEINRWKKWYKQVRPDAEFEDDLDF